MSIALRVMLLSQSCDHKQKEMSKQRGLAASRSKRR